MPSKNEKDLLDALKPEDMEPSEAGKKKLVMPMTPSAMKKMMGGPAKGGKKK